MNIYPWQWNCIIISLKCRNDKLLLFLTREIVIIFKKKETENVSQRGEQSVKKTKWYNLLQKSQKKEPNVPTIEVKVNRRDWIHLSSTIGEQFRNEDRYTRYNQVSQIFLDHELNGVPPKIWRHSSWSKTVCQISIHCITRLVNGNIM
jgi:hypothetical protein